MEHEQDGLLLRLLEVAGRRGDPLQRAASRGRSLGDAWLAAVADAWSPSRSSAATSCRRSTKGACRSTCCCRRARRWPRRTAIAGMVEERLKQIDGRRRLRPPHGPGRARRARRRRQRLGDHRHARSAQPTASREEDPRGDPRRAGATSRASSSSVEQPLAAPDLAHALGRQGAGRHQALRRRPGRAAPHGRAR